MVGLRFLVPSIGVRVPVEQQIFDIILFMNIHQETEKDYPAVRKINESAFETTEEADLVDSLRNNPNYIPELSLVAEDEGEVIGHILFTPINIIDIEVDHKLIALAPMAVLPKYQKKGIGSALIKAGFEKAQELGYKAVIVLGHPGYYPRFGFVPAEQFDIHPPVEEWKEAFFAKELESGSLKNVSGTVSYLKEFGI
jgi:putative acetyltransferase